MSQGDYAVIWMIIVTLLFLAIAALGGIITKPLKRIAVAPFETGKSASSHIAKARIMSFIVLVHLFGYYLFHEISNLQNKT